MDKNLDLLIEWCRKSADSEGFKSRRAADHEVMQYHAREQRLFRAAAEQLEILQRLRTPMEF